MQWLFIQFVLLYRVALRPIMGGHCRFTPSCSEYAIDAIKKYGAFRGAWRALKRILRCHPFGGHGYDPA
jgi:putative membrane protein insertion efficiency factor